MTIDNSFDFTEVNRIVESIKALSPEEIDTLVEVSVENNLTNDPEGLKQTFLSIRGEFNDPNAQ